MSQSQIELIKWMLEDVRKETLAGVEHLSREQLFIPPVKGEFPIGAYLMHFAEVDLSWLEIISGIKQSDEIKKRAYYDAWYDVPNPVPPKEAPEIKEYLETIAETRKLFLDYISSLEDSQLEDEIVFHGRLGERRFTKKWIMYHILEHEAHHRGQMFLLIRKAGWNKKNN